MSRDRDARVMDLLAELLDTPAGQRGRFLESACADDVGLRAEVESLAKAYEEGPDFLAAKQGAGILTSPSIGVGARVGRYTIIERIGEGGFGAVYLAEQHHPVKRRVALKLIKEGMDTRRVIARFNAERQALAMMDHPHIARVYDAGATDAGRPYFVMELVQGVPITRYCEQHQLPIKQRLQLFMQVCQAVQHAHQKGIIHRDLKPTNILVSVQDGKPMPKVIDFGIAKATQGRLTEQSFSTDQQHWLGTPQYMSPEQADGSSDIDTRTDVYSLGVILYELLCGCAPFDFKSSGYSEIQRTIREVDPPPPSSKTIHRELRGDLDRVVLKAMEKDRSRRYETGSALAADIQRYLNNEPVTARTAGRMYRLRKLVRRNRLAFAALAAVAISLATGLITSTALYVRARDAKVAETVLREDAEAKAYASDMLGIQQALAIHDLGRARLLLDRHRPKPGEKDRRGWEWRYLWQQARGDESAVLSRRPAGICSLSVSKDGQLLAIGDDRGGLSIVELQTRKEFAQIPAGESEVHAAFSPRDRLLAFTSVTFDGRTRRSAKLRLWDVGDKKLIVTVPLGEYPCGLAFTGDGKFLLTSTSELHGRLTVWRIADLHAQLSLAMPTGVDTRFAVTGDGSAAAFSSENFPPGHVVPRLRVVDLPSGVPRWREDLGGESEASLAFSPNGQVLAFSKTAGDFAIYLRDALTGQKLGQPLDGHLAAVSALAFSPDGRTLYSASADQTIRRWDVSDPSRAIPLGVPLKGHEHGVQRLAVLPDRTLISGAKDGSVFLWDAGTTRPDPGHTSFRAVNWSFDTSGDTVLSVDEDGQVCRHTGRNLFASSPIMQIPGEVLGAAFLDGRLLLARCGDKVHAFELTTKKLLHTTSPVEGLSHSGGITPQGIWWVNIKDDDTLREWDIRRGIELPTRSAPHGLVAIRFTSDGGLRLVLSGDGTAVLTDMARALEASLSFDMPNATDACFSRDGTRLAICGDAGVGIWSLGRLHAGEKLAPDITTGTFRLIPRSVGFSPDGLRLAVGAQGSEAVKLFDVESGQEVLSLAAGDQFGFYHTGFSPDGSLLASSNQGRYRGGQLHLWRAPTLAEIDAAEADQNRR